MTVCESLFPPKTKETNWGFQAGEIACKCRTAHQHTQGHASPSKHDLFASACYIAYPQVYNMAKPYRSTPPATYIQTSTLVVTIFTILACIKSMHQMIAQQVSHPSLLCLFSPHTQASNFRCIPSRKCVIAGTIFCPSPAQLFAWPFLQSQQRHLEQHPKNETGWKRVSCAQHIYRIKKPPAC